MAIRQFTTVLLLAVVTLLTGCKLDVEITTPDSITQHEPFGYSAEVTRGDTDGLTYSWSLNGVVISNLAESQALVSTPGVHTLSVTVINEKDQEGEATVELNVLPAEVLNPEFDFTIRTADLTGLAIADVAITVNGTETQTDSTGTALLEDIPLNAVMVVTAEKDGYLDQSYRYEFSGSPESAAVVLTLTEQAAAVTFNNEAPATVNTEELSTSVSLPAGAFVDADGNPVTGDIDLAMTPIDIRQIGAAFPGGGQALTENGEVVALITTGMIDFEFTQNGEPLQLAQGATATIQMDLVSNIGADGRVLTEGDTIEMWWFDPATGLWVEEGEGSVIASASSMTGLALQAEVTHFTTWNWDYYKEEDRASFVLNCTREGQLLAVDESCFVRVVGGTLNRSFTVDNGGVTAINLPPGVTFDVYADLIHTGSQIFRGTTSFTTVPGSVSVTVDLLPYPTDTGSVSCFITDGASTAQVACTGTATGDTGTYEVFSTDPGTLIGQFEYVSGELVTVAANIQGFGATQTVDTSLLAGPLNIQLTASVGLGSISCSATLDGADLEYFPCAGRITDDLAGEYVFTESDFSGTPLSGTFAYNDMASVLTVQVVNALNGSSIDIYDYDGNQYVYVNATPDEVILDLNVDTADIDMVYDISSSDIYSISCIDTLGQPVDNCYVSIYGQFENRIFDGVLGWDQPLAPSWFTDSLMFADDTEAQNSFGWASSFDENDPQGGRYYSIDYQVDVISKTVVFVMEGENLNCLPDGDGIVLCICPPGEECDIPVVN